MLNRVVPIPARFTYRSYCLIAGYSPRWQGRLRLGPGHFRWCHSCLFRYFFRYRRPSCQIRWRDIDLGRRKAFGAGGQLCRVQNRQDSLLVNPCPQVDSPNVPLYTVGREGVPVPIEIVPPILQYLRVGCSNRSPTLPWPSPEKTGSLFFMYYCPPFPRLRYSPW